MVEPNKGRKLFPKFYQKWLSFIRTYDYSNGIKVILIILFRNPLTDKILENELKIKKIGYRVRILNKLKAGNHTSNFRFKIIYR